MKNVVGQTYSSNVVKLLKHLEVLRGLQRGIISPIMIHLSPTNVCNLKCSFCCFANRTRGESLDFERLKLCAQSFRKLGTKALEFTGGGEPTLYPQINEAVDFCYRLGYSLGICTNGSNVRKVKDWGKFRWVRIGMYSVDNGYSVDLDYLRSFDVELSAAYVWDNPDLKKFHEMLAFVNENKLPTRIAVNAIKEPEEIKKDMITLKEQCEGYLGDYAFISDFNLKTERRGERCYMHMIKPFVFTDGNVYCCPSSELSVENDRNMNDIFKVCSIEDILKFYSTEKPQSRNCPCKFCKYSQQNDLVEDTLMETHHNEFA